MSVFCEPEYQPLGSLNHHSQPATAEPFAHRLAVETRLAIYTYAFELETPVSHESLVTYDLNTQQLIHIGILLINRASYATAIHALRDSLHFSIHHVDFCFPKPQDYYRGLQTYITSLPLVKHLDLSMAGGNFNSISGWIGCNHCSTHKSLFLARLHARFPCVETVTTEIQDSRRPAFHTYVDLHTASTSLCLHSTLHFVNPGHISFKTPTGVTFHLIHHPLTSAASLLRSHTRNLNRALDSITQHMWRLTNGARTPVGSNRTHLRALFAEITRSDPLDWTLAPAYVQRFHQTCPAVVGSGAHSEAFWTWALGVLDNPVAIEVVDVGGLNAVSFVAPT